MKKVVLSICMIIKNEEQNLRRCLDSLQPLREAVSSELIIVDTGSEDNSVAIAKEYTDKVYFHEWNDNFADMRNISIRYATGKWILIFDADEELIELEGIIGFLRQEHPENVNGAMMIGENIIGRNEEISPIPTVRIFRNIKEFHYTGAIHNQPVISGNILVLKKARLHHYGYIVTDKELMERKFKRTATLLNKELEKDPENVYYRFQLAVSYSMHEEPIPALREIVKACEVQALKGIFTHDNSYLLGTLVQFYAACKVYDDDMVAKAKLCLEIEPTYIDVWYFLAQAHVCRNEFDEAYACYEKYLELLEDFENLPIQYNIAVSLYTLDSGVNAHYNMIGICRTQKKWEQACEHIRAMFKLEPKNDFRKMAYNSMVQTDFESEFLYADEERYQLLFMEEDKELIAMTIAEAERLFVKAGRDVREKYSKIVQQQNDLYGMLNRVRTGTMSLESWAWQFLNEEVEEYPAYFSLLLLALLEDTMLCRAAGNKISETTIREYMKHLEDLDHEEFVGAAKKYVSVVSEISEMNFEQIRLRKNIAKYLLFSGALTGEEYEALFEHYCSLGIAFMEGLYCPQIIKEGRILDVKNVEEAFFLYLALANKSEPIEKVMYYRQASQIFPEMNQGILGLLKKIQLDREPVETVQDNSGKKEMQELKEKLLVYIEELISQEKYQDAKKVIAEAEGILGLDLDLLALKSEVALHAQ